MYKTTAGEKMKALKAEALELARDAKTAMRVSKILLVQPGLNKPNFR